MPRRGEGGGTVACQAPEGVQRKEQESAVASGNSKSSHTMATMWVAWRDELKRPGHERSYAVLKTLKFCPEAVGSHQRI